jgi:hypothetical protein
LLAIHDRERLHDYVDHFGRRVLQDALQEATKAYWLRRAVTFDGVGTPACDEIALACRNHAVLVQSGALRG